MSAERQPGERRSQRRRNLPGLRPGDRVRVYLEPNRRRHLEGDAVLVQFLRSVPSWRPLETWIVDLTLPDGRELRKKQRIVHPRDLIPPPSNPS